MRAAAAEERWVTSWSAVLGIITFVTWRKQKKERMKLYYDHEHDDFYYEYDYYYRSYINIYVYL